MTEPPSAYGIEVAGCVLGFAAPGVFSWTAGLHIKSVDRGTRGAVNTWIVTLADSVQIDALDVDYLAHVQFVSLTDEATLYDAEIKRVATSPNIVYEIFVSAGGTPVDPGAVLGTWAIHLSVLQGGLTSGAAPNLIVRGVNAVQTAALTLGIAASFIFSVAGINAAQTAAASFAFAMAAAIAGVNSAQTATAVFDEVDGTSSVAGVNSAQTAAASFAFAMATTIAGTNSAETAAATFAEVDAVSSIVGVNSPQTAAASFAFAMATTIAGTNHVQTAALTGQIGLNLFAHGNSFIAGQDADRPGAINSPWPVQLGISTTATGISVTISKVGHGAYATGNVAGPSLNLTLTIPTDVDPAYVAGKFNILVLHEVINDLYYGSTGAQAYLHVQQYFQATAVQWECRAVVFPTPRNNAGTPVGYETERQ
ncbi:MAG TPA: hypothetical protein VN903_30465, partial [Polyangia bacterium]|nr:hypothetical protein [Polyangia bacterium]